MFGCMATAVGESEWNWGVFIFLDRTHPNNVEHRADFLQQINFVFA